MDTDPECYEFRGVGYGYKKESTSGFILLFGSFFILKKY